MKAIVVLLFLGCVNAELSQTNYTFTYKMAARCKEYVSQHGYKYEQYFRTETDVTSPTDPGVAFEMHFAILSASNGHVLLSSVPEPTPVDPVYEFVIGGGGNKFCELRRNLRKNAKGSVITKNILSPVEFRPFYIKIDNSGTVQFGREGDALPLINFVDVDPIPIRYFSFASWNNEAKYLFDCPVALANGTEISAPDSKQTEPNMTAEAKLKKAILEARPMKMPPSSTVDVTVSFFILSAHYDPFTSKLKSENMMQLDWQDDGVAWNPQKYNNTTHVLFKSNELWTPTLIPPAGSIVSGPLDSVTSSMKSTVLVLSTGIMINTFEEKFETWCFDESGTLNRWPNDQYTCHVVIEPWTNHEEIKLTIGHEHFLFPTKPKTFGWEMEYSRQVYNRSTFNSLFEKELEVADGIEVNSIGDRLVITLTFRRIGTTYNIVFYVPLMVLMVFVLISFWTTPLTTSRVWFYAGSSTLISFGLSYVDYFVPCHTIPSILILYTCILGGTLLALVINVGLMHAPEQTVFKNRYIQAMLTAKSFRAMCCLPDMKTCQLYEAIDEDQSNLKDSRSVMEMQDENNPKTEREECAEVIDKILFTVYSLTFSVLLACHY